MNEPSAEALVEVLRDIDEDAKEHERIHGEPIPPLHVAMAKGLLRAMSSPSGRALKFLIAPENAPTLAQIQTAEGRNRYRERLATTLESGSIEENRQLVRECRWFAELTPRRRAEMLRAPKQRELAAAIRAELEPIEHPVEGVPSEGASREGLAEAERVKLARALKLASSQVDFERLIEARVAEDWETFAELAFRLNFSFVLSLIPPPATEPYGRRNRSPMRLSTERKTCGWAGCAVVIQNSARFCLEHQLQAKKDKDSEKKHRKVLKAALARETARASEGRWEPLANSDGTISGTIIPDIDLPAARRKLRK